MVKPEIGHVLTSYDVANLTLLGAPFGTRSDVLLREFDTRPRIVGQFAWSGFDCLGEPATIAFPAEADGLEGDAVTVEAK